MSNVSNPSKAVPPGLNLVPPAAAKDGAGKPGARERRDIEQVGDLPVRNFERFSAQGARRLAVDNDKLRASLRTQITEQRAKGENSLLQELERLVPEIQSFVGDLKAAPSMELLDAFIGQVEGAGHKEEASRLRSLQGEPRKVVADGLKDTLVAGAEGHLAECEDWLKGITDDRERLMASPQAQWLRVLQNAWGKLPPDAISTLIRKEDWQDISNVQAGARYGNVGDLLASSVGVLHAFASGQYADLVRLLIAGSGVTGGYINDKGGAALLDDPDADSRSNLGKAIRPMQHPDRAGFLAYSPAAGAMVASGAVRQATDESLMQVLGAQVNAAGVPDIVGGLSLLAGFGAVIMLNDPRTGDIKERIPGGHVGADDKTGMLMDMRSNESVLRSNRIPDLVVTDRHTDKQHNISLYKYLRIPQDQRPRLDEVLLREPVFTDRVTGARNWAVDRVRGSKGKQSLKFNSADGEIGATHVDPGLVAKSTDWGRFQLFSMGSSLTTIMAWFATGERGLSLVNGFPDTAAGFAEGPASPSFWKSTLEVGTVAASAAMTYAFTKCNLAFARAGYENKAKEDEALDHGYLDTSAYEAQKASAKPEPPPTKT